MSYFCNSLLLKTAKTQNSKVGIWIPTPRRSLYWLCDCTQYMSNTLALKKGVALEQWSKGLSVMSEKMFGKRLVSKLWAILLMDADFNRRTKRCTAFGCWTTCKDTNLSWRKFSVNRIELPTMGVWQKRCFMISPVRRALWLPSRPWMHLTVTIG